MAAYTDSLGFYKNSAAFNSAYTNRIAIAEIDIDFAKIAAARTAAGAAALAATDTLDIATLPKGSLILGGQVVLVRAEGAAGTVTINMAGAAPTFATTFDLNGSVGTTAGVGAGTTNVYLTADTAVRMLVNTNSIDVARIKVVVAYLNLGADLGVIPSA